MPENLVLALCGIFSIIRAQDIFDCSWDIKRKAPVGSHDLGVLATVRVKNFKEDNIDIC